MIAKGFLLQTAAADSEVHQEKQKLEDAEKEFAVQLEKTNVALANVQAAAQTNKTNGVSLVPVADGNIVHSNSIVPEEMVQAMLAEPTSQAQSMNRKQQPPLCNGPSPS